MCVCVCVCVCECFCVCECVCAQRVITVLCNVYYSVCVYTVRSILECELLLPLFVLCINTALIQTSSQFGH